MHIHSYNAEDVFELPSSHDKEITVHNHVEIESKAPLKMLRNLTSKDRTMMVSS
jgi:hypothetical protein